MNLWIFGYGSLIWRPGFDYLERRRARLQGWQRRFWQGSHDHRGVPDRPGRVVTLVESGEGYCDGMAYRVNAETVARVFEHLDYREKNGYARFDVTLEALSEPEMPSRAGAISRSRLDESLSEDRDPEIAPTHPATTFPAIVYIAPTDNFAYLGPAPLPDMVRQIVTSHGPSGANLEYLLELAAALRAIDAHDPHVFELEAAVRSHQS